MKIRQPRPCLAENAPMNVMMPWASQKIPRTKIRTSSDWNGVRSSAKPTITDSTPRTALSTRPPVPRGREAWMTRRRR